MTVKELRNILSNYPDDMEVLTKVAFINSVRKDSYGFLGMDIPCMLFTDEEEKRCSNCKFWRLDKNDENRRCSYCFDQDEWEAESEEEI